MRDIALVHDASLDEHAVETMPDQKMICSSFVTIFVPLESLGRKLCNGIDIAENKGVHDRFVIVFWRSRFMMRSSINGIFMQSCIRIHTAGARDCINDFLDE